jgi:hypothetical protein
MPVELAAPLAEAGHNNHDSVCAPVISISGPGAEPDGPKEPKLKHAGPLSIEDLFKVSGSATVLPKYYNNVLPADLTPPQNQAVSSTRSKLDLRRHQAGVGATKLAQATPPGPTRLAQLINSQLISDLGGGRSNTTTWSLNVQAAPVGKCASSQGIERAYIGKEPTQITNNDDRVSE